MTPLARMSRMMAGEASADKMATGMPAVAGLARSRFRTSSP